MNNIITKIQITLGVLLGLLAVYTLLMFVTFTYDSEKLEEAAVYAGNIVAEEGEYPMLLFKEGGAVIDNFTDRLMVSKVMKDPDESAIYNAMYVTDYARYWHGYLVWLRPLSLVFDMAQLRLYISVINYALVLAGVLLLNKRLGLMASVPYALMWLLTFSTVTSGCFQYFSCTFMIEIGVIVMALFYKGKNKMFDMMFFLLTGSLINFFDFLIFPVATLAVPLAIKCLIDVYKLDRKLSEIIKDIVADSLVWGIAYAFTWVGKWIIGTIFTGKSVFDSALNSGKIRMTGDVDGMSDRIRVIAENFSVPVAYSFICIIAVIAIVTAVILSKDKKLVVIVPLLIIWLFPYLWYEVLVNHSLVHTFFTYRSQLGSIFIAVSAIVISISAIASKYKNEA